MPAHASALVIVFRITSFPPAPAESGYPHCRFVLRPAAVKNIMMSNRKSCHDDGALLSRKKRPFLKRCFYPLPAPAGLSQKIVLKEIGGGGGMLCQKAQIPAFVPAFPLTGKSRGAGVMRYLL
jgi:hypothetical protein